MTARIRVTSTDPRSTRYPRSFGRAEARAMQAARLFGAAEIQRRDAAGDWHTVELYARTGSRIVRRQP